MPCYILAVFVCACVRGVHRHRTPSVCNREKIVTEANFLGSLLYRGTFCFGWRLSWVAFWLRGLWSGDFFSGSVLPGLWPGTFFNSVLYRDLSMVFRQRWRIIARIFFIIVFFYLPSTNLLSFGWIYFSSNIFLVEVNFFLFKLNFFNLNKFPLFYLSSRDGEQTFSASLNDQIRCQGGDELLYQLP